MSDSERQPRVNTLVNRSVPTIAHIPGEPGRDEPDLVKTGARRMRLTMAPATPMRDSGRSRRIRQTQPVPAVLRRLRRSAEPGEARDMGDLRPNNGGDMPPEDGGGARPGDLPDFPPEWGTIVIPDDAS